MYIILYCYVQSHNMCTNRRDRVCDITLVSLFLFLFLSNILHDNNIVRVSDAQYWNIMAGDRSDEDIIIIIYCYRLQMSDLTRYTSVRSSNDVISALSTIAKGSIITRHCVWNSRALHKRTQTHTYAYRLYAQV